jgi:type I restriction enzyme S subunit
MDKQQNKTPLVRFLDFKDNWEHKQLNKLLSVSKTTNKNLKYGKEEVLSVSGELGIVNQIKHLGRSYAGVSVHNYGMVELNQIVYTKSPLKANPYGIIKLNKHKAGIVSTLYAVYTVNEKTDGQFIEYYFSLDANLNRYLRPLVRKGAKNDMKISNEYVLNDRVFAPQKKEQQKIAHFFTTLDKKLNQLEEKKNGLEKYKKGMMQQIFSQQIRFKDENGKDFRDWEEKKLGEVSVFLDGRRRAIKSSDRTKMKGSYPYYGASGIIDYVNDYIFDDEIILLGEDGENIISRNSPLAFRVSGKCWINNHAHVIVPIENYDINFLTISLENINYVKYNTGTAQPKLNQIICKGIPIMFPNLDEQTKIANFLSKIANKINAVNTQIEQTNTYKKGLLQSMFVN